MTGALCFLACAWRGPLPAGTTHSEAPSPTVLAMDRTVYKQVAVVDERSTVTEDGHLEIEVTLANQLSDALDVHLDVQFRHHGDERDIVETSWRVVQILGSSTETVRVRSTDVGPDSYIVQLWTRP